MTVLLIVFFNGKICVFRNNSVGCFFVHARYHARNTKPCHAVSKANHYHHNAKHSYLWLSVNRTWKIIKRLIDIYRRSWLYINTFFSIGYHLLHIRYKLSNKQIYSRASWYTFQANLFIIFVSYFVISTYGMIYIYIGKVYTLIVAWLY